MASTHSGYKTQACEIRFLGSKNNKAWVCHCVLSQPTKAKTARGTAKATNQILFSGQQRGNNKRAVGL